MTKKMKKLVKKLIDLETRFEIKHETLRAKILEEDKKDYESKRSNQTSKKRRWRKRN